MDIVDEIEIACPQCGEIFSIEVDTSAAAQRFIEDCAVCCRPMEIDVRCRPGEVIATDVRAA